MEVVRLPAAIPMEFSSKHLTKSEKENKQYAKASVTPRVRLKVPAAIRDNVNYYAIWKKVLKLYDGTELLNALDTDMLARYCIETDALNWMYNLRGEMNFCNSDPGNVELIAKIETRIEAKTKMLNQMALALYMTPRARAGAVPQKPDKDAGDDPNADMFD